MKTFEPDCFAVRIAPGPHAVIEVSGELDLAGVPLLKATVRDLDQSAVNDAVLDLRRLAFIDVAGVRAVLDLHAECLSGATALTIIPGPQSVHRLFELTRLDHLLPFSRP
jgi:anti-anti-sigma factor